MATAAAELNRVGKRPRSSSDVKTATPAKKRHVDDVAPRPSTTRRSATSLRSRGSLPVSSPITKPRGPTVYDPPASPEHFRKDKGSPARPTAQTKVVKRKLNQKQEKSSNANDKFDPRRRSAINPLLVAGVQLSTEDSPGKNTRAKRQGPLKKLDPNYSKLVPVDAEPGREASPELGVEDDRHVLYTSGQQERDRDEAAGSDRGTGKAGESNEAALGVDEVATKDRLPNEMPRQRITDQDRNYMSRLYERNARKSTLHTSPTKAQEKENKPKSHVAAQHVPPDEGENQDENQDEDEAVVSAKATKKRGRTKMSDEEKRLKAEEKARLKKENAMETEAANTKNFGEYGKNFIAGIENLVGEAGGMDVWFNLGAGAKTITSMVARKREMDGARAEVLWKKLCALKSIFSGQEDNDEERINRLISSLQTKATWQVLTRDRPILKDDSTIIDLYEHVIPQSVYVLKEHLRGRFVSGHLFALQEIQSLTDVAVRLCDIAADWEPKPTSLESGIRNQVRHNIRPNLGAINNVVRDVGASMEWREQKQREAQAFNRRQEARKEEKRRMWERMNQHARNQVTFTPQLPQTASEYSRRASPLPTPIPPPPPPLRRRPTEEIPAPDPNTIWTEKENVALLNGLQEYLGSDRYARILRDSRFGKALREKDAEQCIDRAAFFRAGCSQILKDKAEEGDNSFDWLRSV